MIVFLSLVVLILSVIAHEVAHGYAANSLGDPTARLAGRLTLNPLPHIDPVGSVIIPPSLPSPAHQLCSDGQNRSPITPTISRISGGARPSSPSRVRRPTLLAIIFGLIVRFGPILGFDANMLYLAATIAFINLFLGLFNLIPFPPLDGFTVLRTILPWHLASGLVRLEQQIHGAGMLSLILFLLFFSYIFVGPFFKLVVWLFGLLTGGSI